MKIKTLLFIILVTIGSMAWAKHHPQHENPKREFRAAWIQSVNGQFKGMSTAKMQQTLINQLNSLQDAGINAIIFQIRPEADAFYPSSLEPWSRFLTGQQGLPPSPYWDPLQFMIDECHKRNMELHAWINPYRALTNINNNLTVNHLYFKNPELFVRYGNQLYFDPAYPENRDYISKVVTDIVSRYDIDAIHMDDYFYPYPINGVDYPDSRSYAMYRGNFTDKGDWRRDNVNKLIKQLHSTIHDTKPWVKFGISPFGIYRNVKSDPNGSQTNGLQNYDELYADVLLWMREGWVDYIIPQIYWHVGHPRADYGVLVKWWAENANDCPLFIGESVMNTVENKDPNRPSNHQLGLKMALQRAYPQIGGSCQWPASAVVENAGNYREILKQVYHKYPALVPTSPRLDDKAPGEVKKLKPVWVKEGYHLFWTAPKAKDAMDEAVQYVVYRFGKKEKIDLDDPSKIVAITRQTFIKLPYSGSKTKYQYVVTALDRLHNESKGAKCKVKL